MLVSPAPGSRIGDEVPLAVKVTAPPGQPVSRVDYFGHYEDVNVRLDGANHGWQYWTLHGEPRDHMGTSSVGPSFAVRWKTTWVPDQRAPMRFAARVTDATGLATVTPIVDGVTFGPRSVSVRLFKASGVPKNQATRAGKPTGNEVDIGPHGLAGARAARMFLATWSGTWADAIGVNGHAVATTVSPEQNALSVDHLDVPVRALRPGVNEPYVLASTTTKHGTDVMWPGIELKIQYPARAAPRAGRARAGRRRVER